MLPIILIFISEKGKDVLQVEVGEDKVPDVLFCVVIHWTSMKFFGHENSAFLVGHRILLIQEFYEATDVGSVLISYLFT